LGCDAGVAATARAPGEKCRRKDHSIALCTNINISESFCIAMDAGA
jgi:hypothetical protein